MSKEGILITIGVLTALSPFSGLPLSWLSWILPILGIATIYIGYAARRSRAAQGLPMSVADEHTNTSESVRHEAPSSIA